MYIGLKVHMHAPAGTYGILLKYETYHFCIVQNECYRFFYIQICMYTIYIVICIRTLYMPPRPTTLKEVGVIELTSRQSILYGILEGHSVIFS